MPVEEFYDDDTFLIGFFESPKTLKQIKKLRKEFKKMAASMDRLNASIAALDAKVDEHMAGDTGNGGTVFVNTDAEVDAASDKVDAIKAKFDAAAPVIDGTPAPVEPAPVEPMTQEEIDAKAAADKAEADRLAALNPVLNDAGFPING